MGSTARAAAAVAKLHQLTVNILTDIAEAALPPADVTVARAEIAVDAPVG